MSEKLHAHEQETKPEISNNVDSEAASSRRLEAAEKVETLDLNEARTAIQEAQPATKEKVNERSEIEADTSNDVRWWSKELGRQTFDRTLTSVRRQLSAPEKQLSKFIHKPVVEKSSDFVGKTFARPSGILLGGIFSFVGSLGVYLIARHLGGEFRYSIFAATFIGGYLLGLIVELVWRLVVRKKPFSS